MSDVSFDEVSYSQNKTLSHTEPTGLSGLVLTSGFAKTHLGAQYVLGVVAGILIIGAGWFYYSHTPHKPSKAEIQSHRPEKEITLPIKR